ncbi:MAG: response regulator, partial [Bacteroidota bacterium]|nr:response regulator [Bacteroidota bacterium]
HIEVSDSGIGISKEDQMLIFDEFVQLNNGLTQKQRGAGLGLAIVKKLIVLQDGKIEVESSEGKGTRFLIQIPYQKGNPGNIVKRNKEQLIIPSWFKKLHFLIVDDEEFNLYLIKNILNKWGVLITEAHNGSEAAVLAEKNMYDLILMDIRMPVMDGYEATKLILQHRASTKIIALTATNKLADIQKLQLAGIKAFLLKPFAESQLLSAVSKILPEKREEPMPEAIAKNTSIDLDELERISGGDTAFFNEMLKIFIRSCEEAMAKFDQNLQDPDRILIKETAHKLAAPAKHLQASKLYEYLKKLENNADSYPPEEIKKLIGKIEQEINSINFILKQKLKAE